MASDIGSYCSSISLFGLADSLFFCNNNIFYVKDGTISLWSLIAC
jgi:hypothetical protein